MKNLYNKGKYRGYEYAKHLPPYLKRQGNKMWRKTAAAQILEQTEEFTLTKIKKNRKRDILVKIKIRQYGSVYSYYKKYHSMRDVENAIKRNCVINASKIINNKHYQL